MSKLDEKEFEELKLQEQKKQAIVKDLGVLELQKHELLHIFASVQSEQESLKSELETKYGKISIDLNDGSFTEIVEDAVEVEE